VLFSNLSQPGSCSPKTIEILLYEVQIWKEGKKKLSSKDVWIKQTAVHQNI